MTEFDRPPPGEELRGEAPVVRPRQAATVVLLRGGDQALEVLLVQRNPTLRFMGGAWVFPGGAVGAGEGADGHRAAALRELEEEAAVRLAGPGQLVPFSRWITPAEVTVRFDTHFFVALCPEGAEPRPDGHECVQARWFTPRAALDAGAGDEILLVFPTIKHLEQLDGFASAHAALRWAAAHTVVPVQPRVVLGGETARVLLPGEPGYEEAAPA